MTTFEALKERVTMDLNREAVLIAIHDVIAEVIKEKWVGKKVNKRLETQVKERLETLYGDTVVVYYTGRALKIWGIPGLDVKGGYPEFYLGNLDALDLEKFEKDADGCHGYWARERNKNRTFLLEEGTTLKILADKIDAKKRLEEEIEALTAYETPGHDVHWIVKDLGK